MNQWLKCAGRGLVLLAWMGVIYYFSDQANSNTLTEEIFGSLNYFVRKGAHMTEYAILFWLALWFKSALGQLQQRTADSDRKQIWRLLPPFLIAFFYALSDEWHQSFVPGRSALFSDVLIDSCGSGLAALLSFLLAGRAPES